MQNMIIYLLTFLAVLLPVVWFVVLSGGEEKIRRRGRSSSAELPVVFRWSAGPAKLLDAIGLGSFFRQAFPAQCRKLQKQLTYAGLPLTPEQVSCSRLIVMAVLAGITALVTAQIVEPDQTMSIPVASLIAAFIGWALPGVTIGNLVQERRDGILHALPFSIDLIASAMRGGLDFSAAIRFYVKTAGKGPLTDEYSVMLGEMELGVLRTNALQNMAERIQIKEFSSFVSAVVMGTELGASLSDTMEIQGEEMRKLRFSIAECKAQRAPSLMLIPMALFIMPAVFIIILTPVFLKMQSAGVPLF